MIKTKNVCTVVAHRGTAMYYNGDNTRNIEK